MPDQVIAVDSLRHSRTWPGGIFLSSMGSCLSIDDGPAFKQQYKDILNDLLPKYGISQRQSIYKSYQLAQAFESRTLEFHNLLSEFTRRVLTLPGIKMTLFYTTLNTRRLQENVRDEEPLSREDEEAQIEGEEIAQVVKPIRIYGREGSPIDEITVKEFLDKLDSYYVSICAWKLTDLTKIYNKRFILDGFEGEITDAWMTLARSNKVAIAYKGDQCNAYISGADLITKFADLRLKLWRFPIVKDALYRAFNALDETGGLSDKFFIKRIWNPDIRMMVPSIKRPIDVAAYVLHPCLFLYKEENTAEERIRLENSPMFGKVLDLAFERNGCLQFYEPKKHTALMQDDDIFLIYGPRGRAEYDKLKKMHYKLELLEL